VPPDDLPETFGGAQGACSIIVLGREVRMGVMQHRASKVGVIAAVDSSTGRRRRSKQMRAHCHAYGRMGRLSNHTCQLLWCYRRAVICREPESHRAASRPRQYRPVFGNVAVNDRSEQLIYGPLIGAFLFGLSGRKDNPPLTPNLHKAGADLQLA